MENNKLNLNRQIIGPGTPRPRNIRPRKIEDYPHLPLVYREVAKKLSSPFLLGPPICDELIAFVQHVFSEEEAAIVRHLGFFIGTKAAKIAQLEHRPLDEVESILKRLTSEKPVLVTSGQEGNLQYRLVPIVPGMFEMMLSRHTPESLTPWHHRFVELFEALYETGYSLDYGKLSTPTVRYLPIEKAIEAHPMALPTDKLEVVLDQFDSFAVGNCQCRLAMQSLGRGCGKPLENCMVMGKWAEYSVKAGWRKVSKKEALEIKREAESHGLVNWMINVQSTSSQCSCSCCGCCCHALRLVSEFSAPGLIAPPHFIPRFDPAKCVFCGKCAINCPMQAITVDLQNKTFQYHRQRCIGCGLCVLACQRQKALVMEPVADYRPPYKNWYSLIARAAPEALWNAWKTRRQR